MLKSNVTKFLKEASKATIETQKSVGEGIDCRLVDWRASVPEKCQTVLSIHKKGRPGNYSLPGPMHSPF